MEITGCTLDAHGMASQRDRYARLAPQVARLRRDRGELLVEFRDGFDRRLLEEALAVERACCPFFEFELGEGDRRLRTTVSEPDKLAALDAIEHALRLGSAGA